MGAPMSKDHLQEWEHDGVVYKHKPVIGETEAVLLGHVDKLCVDHRPFIDAARDEVDRSSKGKKWDKGERAEAIRTTAIEMATLKDGASTSEMLTIIDAIFDLFIVGWSCGVKFPEDGKPSALLGLQDKQAFYSYIQTQIRIGSADAKKS